MPFPYDYNYFRSQLLAIFAFSCWQKPFFPINSVLRQKIGSSTFSGHSRPDPCLTHVILAIFALSCWQEPFFFYKFGLAHQKKIGINTFSGHSLPDPCLTHVILAIFAFSCWQKPCFFCFF